MTLRYPDGPEEKASIAVGLALRHPPLRANVFYIQSIPAIVEDRAFKFVVVEDPDLPDRPVAVGLLSLYRDLFFNTLIVGAEALWFREGDFAARMPAWQEFVEGINDLCVSADSLASPEDLEELLRLGWIGNSLVSEARPRLAALGQAGTYSALASGPASADPFTARVARFYNSAYFRGTRRPVGGLLYRGEGRLSGDGWKCDRLVDVGLWHVHHGFAARGSDAFGGSVVEQILHQGYVAQGTVSLTTSFDVAARYATSGGTKPEGIVFTLDTQRISSTIFDSYATMTTLCRWISDAEFGTLTAIVGELGVKEAGAFLECCHAHACQRATTLPSPIDTPPCLSQSQLLQLHEHQISKPAVDRLYRELQAFWMGVFGPTIALDTDGRAVSETPLHALLYFHAFAKVRGPLEVAYRRRLKTTGDPGWDLTPFGYIAKSCRDREFFSTGMVPGDSIADAAIVEFVDGKGRMLPGRGDELTQAIRHARRA